MSECGPAPSPEAFGLERFRYVSFIGGGGKTSLMFALAGALAARGQSVLTTTTTRMRRSEAANAGGLLVAPPGPLLGESIRRELERSRQVTAASSLLEDEDKLTGFTADQVDALFERRVADFILVEADGSAGRSLKAHLDHEPVVPAQAQLVIAVIGVDCVGKPLNERNVHRASLLGDRLGLAPESTISADDAARIFFHADGYLKRIGPGAEVAVFLSKVNSPEAELSARRLTEALRERDTGGRIAGIAAGDLRKTGSG